MRGYGFFCHGNSYKQKMSFCRVLVGDGRFKKYPCLKRESPKHLSWKTKANDAAETYLKMKKKETFSAFPSDISRFGIGFRKVT